MAFSLFQQDIFAILGIASTSTEEEIHSALDTWKLRIQGGYIQNTDDIAQIESLTLKISDKKTRIISMILHGYLDFNDLDRQIKRLKKILNYGKIIAQEWIDVFSSLHLILYDEKFRFSILDKCNLTSKDSSEDENIFQSAVDEIFQALLLHVVSECETAFKNSEKSNAFEFFKVINEFPGFLFANKKKAIDKLIGLCSEYILASIETIKTKLDLIPIESSKYKIKAIISQIEREVRELVFETFDIIDKYDFEGKKALKKKLNEFLQLVLTTCHDHNYSEKTNFFIVEVSARNAELAKFADKTHNKSIQTDIRNADEVIKTVKNIAKNGEIKKAKKLFYKEKRKFKTPYEIQLFEQADNDPFFFMSEKIKPPHIKNNSFIQKNELFKNEDGDVLFIIWLKILFPIYPLRTAIYNSNGEYIGAVKLSFKHRILGNFLVTCFIGFFIFLLILLRLSIITPSNEDIANKELTTIYALQSSDEKHKKLLEFLCNTTYTNTKSYSKAINEIISLTKSIFDTYSKNNKIEEFLINYGNKIIVLPINVRLQLFNHLFSQIKSHLMKNEFKPEELIHFSMQIGGVKVGSLIINLKLKYFSEKNDDEKVKEIINFSVKNGLIISDESLNFVINKNLITVNQALFICEKYDDLPARYWEQAIMEIWEIRSTFNTNEQIALLKKVGNHFPALKTDLLLIILDKNKKRVFKWNNHMDDILKINSPSIKKRALIEACISYINKGDYNKAIKYAINIPKNPENDELFFLQIPILHLQKKYGIILQFIEKYIPAKKKKLSYFYKYVIADSKLNRNKFKEAQKYFNEIFETKFKDYLTLWKKLNKRESVVRNYVFKMLKDKKGKYETMGRKIYLIQDNKEADQFREKFILEEIAKDFNVQKIKKELAKNSYILSSITGLIECFINSKDSQNLIKAKDIIFEMKNEFYDYNIQMLLAKVFYFSGQKTGAFDTLLEIESTCIKKSELTPLLKVLDYYKEFENLDAIKKLTKLIIKNTDDNTFIQNTYRKVSSISDKTDDKLYWLKKIKDKSFDDIALISLLEISYSKEKADLNKMITLLEQLSQNAEKYLLIENIPLLKEIADELFLSYRFTNSINALSCATDLYKKIIDNDGINPIILNKYFHSLWFQVLEQVFRGQENIHIIDENNIQCLWYYIENMTGKSLLNNIETNNNFILCKNIFQEIFKETDFFVEPPGFFAILKTEGINVSFLNSIEDSDLRKTNVKSFSDFWNFGDQIEKNYKLKMKDLKLEESKKLLKDTPSTDFKKFSEATLKWVACVLEQWFLTKDSLKMGLPKLFEKVAFSNGLSQSLKGDRLFLDLKIIKLALWYDPNKNEFDKLTPTWNIIKTLSEKNEFKKEEFSSIFDDAKKIIDEYKPFLNEDLILILCLDNTYRLKTNNKTALRKVINMEKILSPFKYKKFALDRIEKTIIN